MPGSFAESVQIYSERTASSLKFILLIFHLAHVGWPNATERKFGYLFDIEFTLWGLLLVGIAELRVKDGDLGVDESVFMHGLTSSDVVLLNYFIQQKS